MSTKLLLVSCLVVALGATAYANSHFFPRLRPLFVGLDEAKIPASAQNALLQAKSDFQRARHYATPRFATYSGRTYGPHGNVYQGHGYRVTMVHDESSQGVLDGPEIVLESSITGGEPYRYSEVDLIKE